MKCKLGVLRTQSLISLSGDQEVIASQSLPMFAVDKDAAEAAGVRRPGCTNTPSVF